MNNIFHKIMNDFRSGKNIDAYIAVILNIGLTILSFLRLLPIEILGAAILTSLSWLTINSLSERKENQNQLEKFLEQVRDSTKRAPPASDFFVENYVHNSEALLQAVNDSHEMFVVGMGLPRFIASFGSQIRRILSQGGNVKFILIDPLGEATKMSADRGTVRMSLEQVIAERTSAIEKLISYGKEPSCKGNLEVKFVDFLVPYTIFGFDASNSDKGKIFVWITPFQEPSEKRPGFILEKRLDAKWYDFFYNQFQKLWDWEKSVKAN
jgi:hypothetical protein